MASEIPLTNRLQAGWHLARLLTALLLPVAASAQLVTYDVSVTSSNQPGFTPTSFTETYAFTLDPNPGLQYYPAAGNLTKAVYARTAAHSSTPFTPSLLAQLGQYSLDSSLYLEIAYYQDYGYGSGQIRFQDRSTRVYQSGGLWYYEIYNHEVATSFNLVSAEDVVPLTFLGSSEVLQNHPTLHWTESIYAQIATDSGFSNIISSQNISYSGTANLTAIAIPEPATGAASAGLAGLGLALWRRRLAQPAAGRRPLLSSP